MPAGKLERPQHARQRRLLQAGFLVLVTLIVYIPALRGGFVWDDDSYVTANETLRDLEGLRRIWFEPGAVPQYYPLVHTTFWIEQHLWNLNPFGYHLVNVLLHALSAILVWALLRRLRVPGSWIAALIFAIHPVHVESVAWITERKNVLSGAFYLGAMLAYFRFSSPEQDPTHGGHEFSLPEQAPTHERHKRNYMLALGLFLCALLSKTVAASMPAAILLMLWWQRRRGIWREALGLIPFFVLGVILSSVTAWVERHHVGAVGESWDLSLLERFLVAGRAIMFYTGKLFWPSGLTFIYPRWTIDAAVWWQYIYPLATAVVLLGLWRLRGRIGRGPLVAALFFAGTLTPALGFVNVYPFRFSFVADHFQYLASLGIIVLAVGVAAAALKRMGRWASHAGPVAALVVLVVLAMTSWRQGHIYMDVETLWRDTLAKNPKCWMAHLNLGTIMTQRGRNEDAAAYFAEAVRLKPEYAMAQCNLGVALERLGRFEESMARYREALRIDPQDVSARMNLANLLAVLGETDKAAQSYREVLRIQPDLTAARINLGALLRKLGKRDQAIEQFTLALQTDPLLVKAWVNLGIVLQERGRLEDAVTAYRRALALGPKVVMARLNLGAALRDLGRREEAARELRKVLQIAPRNTQARGLLEALLREERP